MNDNAIQCERNLAGCLLVNPVKTLAAIRSKVMQDDFLDQNAGAIFSAAVELIDSAKPCDATIIQTEANVSFEYCKNAMIETATLNNAAEYARLIHEAAQRRKAQDVGAELANGEIETVEAIAKLQELTKAQFGGVVSPQEAAQKSLDIFSAAADGKAFLSTGYKTLDKMLSGGLVNGGMITFAARPGTGKTTVAICIAENVAASNHAVLYISLEMTSAQIWACRIANAGELNRSKLLSGGIIREEGEELSKLYSVYDELQNRPFYIYDAPAKVEDIERLARTVNSLSLIVIDHIGLITNPARSTRYEHMTDTAHRIKQLALSLQVPILSLCQLNRSSVQRERPTMADLRDSGAIEEDSDAVILLYRDRQSGADWESLDFLIDKNRHGETGILELGFCGKYSKVEENCY